jgi:tRNA(His) guanylyltransferase
MSKNGGGPRAARMKQHEAQWTSTIPRDAYVVLRVDGRAFRQVTKNFKRPFSEMFMQTMDAVAARLCFEIQNSVFAYVQSDEISILIYPPTTRSELWFGGDVAKTLSVSAGIASAVFTMRLNQFGSFDSRILVLPNHMEVINYFLWRQRDCSINAISMAAESMFGGKELRGKSTEERSKMMFDQHGVLMSDYPEGAQRGRILTQTIATRPVEYVRTDTGEKVAEMAQRTSWTSEPAPWFDWDTRGFLDTVVPKDQEELA